MSILTILLVGILIVLGGILLLRLNAFLVLLLAAFVVSSLTPDWQVANQALLTDAAKIDSYDFSERVAVVRFRTKVESPKADAAFLLVQLGNSQVRPKELSEVTFIRPAESSLAGEPSYSHNVRVEEHLDPTVSLENLVVVSRQQWRSAVSLSRQNISGRVTASFASTCGKIGILIAMAAIIGACMLESGAADRIVTSMLRLCGDRGAPVALIGASFLLAIPVFFDTVFYLMIPLVKSLRLRTGKNYLLYLMCVIAGGTMAHSLVPPTPGPLLVAEQLGIDVGTFILAGGVVGICSCVIGYFYARLMNGLMTIPLRDEEGQVTDEVAAVEKKQQSQPALWISLLPVLLPVFCIGGNTILSALNENGVKISTEVAQVAAILGDKNIALSLAAAIAMATLLFQRGVSRDDLAKTVQTALASGGVIILITAAGGAFGRAMQQTGVAHLIEELPHVTPTIVVLLAFLITVAIRTAQGSATVAMITSAGIFAGMDAAQLGFHPVYLGLAIGCGSKPISWMNDSGFWVISRLSGMTEREGLKVITPLMAVMGVAGLLVTLLGVWFFPMKG